MIKCIPQKNIFQMFRVTLNQSFRSLDNSLVIFKWYLEFNCDQEDPSGGAIIYVINASLRRIHHYLVGMGNIQDRY